MARQRKKNTAKATNREQSEKLDEEDQRIVTLEIGIQQNLEPAQLFYWMKGMGSAPTIMHGHEQKKSVEKIQAPTVASIAITPTDLAENETEMAMAARKLTFSTGLENTKPTLAAVIQGNRSIQQGLKFNYYPPTVKDGRKIVRLNMIEVEEQTRKWQTSLIGPMILKNWEADFKMSKELMTNVPVWVTFPGLPIQYWTGENLGRIASSIGKPICTDKLTAQEARISYARMLIEMDISQALPEDVLIETPNGELRQQQLKEETQNKVTTAEENNVNSNNEDEQRQEADFQIAKSKGKQVQKERNTVRKNAMEEAIQIRLQQNRFTALRIQEKEDASSASNGVRVPVVQPPMTICAWNIRG
ncbi:hypothetical protein A4A49_43485 [Nicotiana attenuata]|uniref:Uncharacterized protein n=1 Tax=Nicotiana attenuata TaxID=49451 RepID=A0A1J6JQT7_NICAT|nr:hypothetical protein A4A49_43485 [Nicotiana attenuata]